MGSYSLFSLGVAATKYGTAVRYGTYGRAEASARRFEDHYRLLVYRKVEQVPHRPS